MSVEEWRAVAGFEGLYEVSSHGQVRSLERYVTRTDGRRQKIRQRTLKAPVGQGGYRQVVLRDVTRGRTAYVHELVALAFLGDRPEGLEVRHYDGDSLNNSAVNLRYGTDRENMLDKKRHGTEYQSNWTHCSSGHPYNDVNTRIDADGRRTCRPCRNARNAEYRARLSSAA